METFLEKDKKLEVDEVLNFLSLLNDEEKKEFKIFMNAAKFLKKNDVLKTA